VPRLPRGGPIRQSNRRLASDRPVSFSAAITAVFLRVLAREYRAPSEGVVRPFVGDLSCPACRGLAAGRPPPPWMQRQGRQGRTPSWTAFSARPASLWSVNRNPHAAWLFLTIRSGHGKFGVASHRHSGCPRAIIAAAVCVRVLGRASRLNYAPRAPTLSQRPASVPLHARASRWTID